MASGAGSFDIEIEFVGDGISPPQQEIFRQVANQLGRIIVSDVPSVEVTGDELAAALAEAQIELPDSAIRDRFVDDLLIFAKAMSTGAAEGDLGGGRPLLPRPDSFRPSVGVMEFDPVDLPKLEQEGNLAGVVLHEMCHVLGFGLVWPLMGLIEGAGSDDPVFVGEHAMREYASLRGSGEPLPVPVENVGAGGRRDGHWRETVFGGELMTPVRDLTGPNPLSRLTIASLKDVGYDVDLDAAEPFELPGG